MSGNNKDQEKKELETALNNLKIIDSVKKAENRLNEHIGFEQEKETFLDHIRVYKMTNGNFWPVEKVICYFSAPGMGKTTFVHALAEAMGRKYETISLSGFQETDEYSILGDESKPSLVAWAIKKNGCKNPVILLDELEKAEDPKVQQELLELFKKYQSKEKFTDKYFQKEIELKHITFFATINWIDDLNRELKEEIEVTELVDFTRDEKKAILRLKADGVQKSYQELIISDQNIEEILNYVKEIGIRQSERVLYKIEEEYIYYKNKNKKPDFMKNFQIWIKNNVFPYQEEFQITLKHYLLFSLLGINFVFLASLIFRKFILKGDNNKVLYEEK
ncbi:AAA family ATPase [endosymbiont GvMRE of Glomus versiforme]|uniref:AAA family ATPase n=1 Tax=endosymbiont GvMRE of Glomus versiforme TaxID=2039283 RepID=UPI000ED5A04B|nr:AAA family ATPase [endosymbiont GvMRE of Glomus versiforme]RHZ35570.1 Lon protease [endosymbiont GvMRE of Glomus versiforme]